MGAEGKWPRLSAAFRGGRDGAIAQLGERVVRNDEVGGSIPPGSTTLRPSGYAWRSHEWPEGRSVVSGEAQRAKTDKIGKYSLYFPAIYAWRSHGWPKGEAWCPAKPK